MDFLWIKYYKGGIKIKYISNLIIPFLVLIIVIYGNKKKINVYDTFIEGVKDSFSMITNLFPTLLSMIFAVNIFTNSGILNGILNLFKPLFNLIHTPIEILPLGLIRPISSSASLAYLNTIFSKYGPDSFIGTLGSVMQGCTDTTLYVVSLYLGSIGIKKIRYTLIPCFFADLMGIVGSIIIVKLLF